MADSDKQEVKASTYITAVILVLVALAVIYTIDQMFFALHH